MSPGNHRACNSASCWSVYLLLIYGFHYYILLLMWPHFRNDCNPCLLSHTETKHKQLVPISFTARTISSSLPLQKLCSALQPWMQSLSWSVNTSGRKAWRARRAVAQPWSQRRPERWYSTSHTSHTPVSFLSWDMIHRVSEDGKKETWEIWSFCYTNFPCL